MSRADDPNHWRDKAAKALRLAQGVTDEDVANRLKTLAADYLERAEAVAAETPAPEVVARPEAMPQQMQQQQQQPQPDPEPKKDE